MDDLQDLLEQLKAATADRPPYKGFSDDEKALMDQIRAYGESAIDSLIAFMAALMAETEATMVRDTDEDVELTYYFADAHITDILGGLPLTEDHVRRLFSLLADYPDNDWYHGQLIGSIIQRGEVVVGPALEVVRDRANDYFVRNTAAEVLGGIAKEFPDQRERIADELVAIMSGVKRSKETDDDRVVNTFMLSTLGETRQEQHIPFIKKMFKSRRVDESVADLNWVLDSIQGIDPMDRLSVLDDSVFAWEAKLGELALSLGYEDTDELLDAISAGEIPDPFDSDDLDDKFLPESYPSWLSFDRLERLEPFHAEKLPGRNDPCWCGSGKKYKHCHMREDKQKKSGDS